MTSIDIPSPEKLCVEKIIAALLDTLSSTTASSLPALSSGPGLAPPPQLLEPSLSVSSSKNSPAGTVLSSPLTMQSMHNAPYKRKTSFHSHSPQIKQYNLLVAARSRVERRARLHYLTALNDYRSAIKAYADVLNQSPKASHNILCQELISSLETTRLTLPLNSEIVPPPPRLVGIELNPGPPKKGGSHGTSSLQAFRPSTAQIAKFEKAASAIVAGPGPVYKNKKTTTQKPSSSRAESLAKVTEVTPGVRSSNVVVHSKAKKKPHKVPFNASTLSVWLTPTGFLALTSQGATNPPASPPVSLYMDVHPVGDLDPLQFNLFGNEIATMASIYQKYKIDELEAEFVPTLGTSTNGQVVIASLLDPLSNGVPTYPLVSDVDGSVEFPIWESVKGIRFSGLDRSWKFVTNVSNNLAIQRQAFAGTIIAAQQGMTLPSINTFIGSIRLVGSISFMEIASSLLVNTPSSSIPAALSSAQWSTLGASETDVFGALGTTTPVSYSTTGGNPLVGSGYPVSFYNGGVGTTVGSIAITNGTSLQQYYVMDCAFSCADVTPAAIIPSYTGSALNFKQINFVAPQYVGWRQSFSLGAGNTTILTYNGMVGNGTGTTDVSIFVSTSNTNQLLS
jgi:hypothetical protein